MATDILIYNGTAVTAALLSSAQSTAIAHQSGVIDFGTPRAANWLARLTAYVGTAAPTAGGTVDVYIGFSAASTGGFPAGLGTAAATAAVGALTQLEYVGSLVVQAVTTVQIQDVGVIYPKLQYGVIVYQNNTSQTVQATTNLTAFQVTPIKDQSQ